MKLPEENPTIGIVLCKDKNNAVVEMTLPENNTQIFASKYETVLPSKAELQKLLMEQNGENWLFFSHACVLFPVLEVSVQWNHGPDSLIVQKDEPGIFFPSQDRAFLSR